MLIEINQANYVLCPELFLQQFRASLLISKRYTPGGL